ncbi:branched-chain amino acid ABC transporter permease [Hoyosella rhizosphaerae]|uniref:Branched-chain amino acid ABC transporter permease n=1 Tax=Hoyosella rhizosphaerae TaxID=1755582 RepID=A0A916U9U4_9ACTN|nr:branched-chain amino acid ABC transporter permease [Hoyosella rhizosphaerae]MBN4926098.1 branched-chain amino acid ABC transporter permease [Hoyosella rhizosphaerae]GGC65618.1 branched-chain amino acid ABC transporter permease [Hoyosella rhizosphaerae]
MTSELNLSGQVRRASATPAKVPVAVRRGRPKLYTSYDKDQAIWNTPAKAWWTIGLIILAILAPFFLTRDLTVLLSLTCVYAIGGIGLNLLTGYAGQVSLGHAFFVGLGAYTAAFFGGDATTRVWGLGWDMALWLPLSAIIPAIVGLLVAPFAARVRGLYLATLTLALLMLGDHLFREWRSLTGGSGVGRAPANLTLFGVDLSQSYRIGGYVLTRQVTVYLLCLLVLIAFAVAARNIVRSRYGRSFAAVRDRDIAAEVMGIPLQRTKTLAFVLSSGYAGVCGALLSVVVGRISADRWNLMLSIDFLAVVLIGGMATISGSIIGAAFVVLLPRVIDEFSHLIPFLSASGVTGGGLTVDEFKAIVFGLLIVVFIVAEPRGLFGIWLRVRNYFKAWPFSR